MSALARGIVLQKDGEKLIIQASEADVVKFALGAQVLAEQQAKKPLKGAEVYALLNGGEHLYSSDGTPIARVLDVQIDHGSRIDVTSFSDSAVKYVYGPCAARFTIRAEGPL